MSEPEVGVPEGPPEVELVETGNYPDAEDGPLDDVPQTQDPQFDDDLVDGGTLEAEA
ncbi:MAG TPA: hypothetical protein VG497_19740 [Kribbella sp.]|nr:hypothetical protein [Kribbella sp.]